MATYTYWRDSEGVLTLQSTIPGNTITIPLAADVNTNLVLTEAEATNFINAQVATGAMGPPVQGQTYIFENHPSQNFIWGGLGALVDDDAMSGGIVADSAITTCGHSQITIDDVTFDDWGAHKPIAEVEAWYNCAAQELIVLNRIQHTGLLDSQVDTIVSYTVRDSALNTLVVAGTKNQLDVLSLNAALTAAALVLPLKDVRMAFNSCMTGVGFVTITSPIHQGEVFPQPHATLEFEQSVVSRSIASLVVTNESGHSVLASATASVDFAGLRAGTMITFTSGVNTGEQIEVDQLLGSNVLGGPGTLTATTEATDIEVGIDGILLIDQSIAGVVGQSMYSHWIVGGVNVIMPNRTTFFMATNQAGILTNAADGIINANGTPASNIAYDFSAIPIDQKINITHKVVGCDSVGQKVLETPTRAMSFTRQNVGAPFIV
jgi:hypothetical protein